MSYDWFTELANAYSLAVETIVKREIVEAFAQQRTLRDVQLPVLPGFHASGALVATLSCVDHEQVYL